jgi:two-component system, chemotaxis family, CheB/CheR fusion protein
MSTSIPSSSDQMPQFDVVAVGASAGGVEALHVVVSSLPASFPAAMLIVQHMDPRHKSLLAGLLGRRCLLPVKQASDGESIRGAMVYIAQPNAHMIVRAGQLRLTDSKLVHFSRPSIDALFESVADAYGDRAIGVILSGSGVDGSVGPSGRQGQGRYDDRAGSGHRRPRRHAPRRAGHGLRRLHPAFGRRRPRHREPRASELWRARLMEEDSRDALSGGPVFDAGFRPLLEKLSSRYNFDFREYREAALARRIRTRMSQVRSENLEAYSRYLEEHAQEHIALFNTILINVTGFFRDPEGWAMLRDDVLPQVIADAADSRSIRIWSAGCSSGGRGAVYPGHSLGRAPRRPHFGVHDQDLRDGYR